MESYLGASAYTAKAVVGVVDGRVIALGGLVFVGGKVIAFCDMDDEMRKYPLVLHKTAKAVMQMARDGGHRYVWAERDQSIPGARRWLERLGFKPVDEDGAMMLWRP